MEKSLCVFKTHNHAVAAWGKLKRAGIECMLVQTPKEIRNEKTCSYGVSFNSETPVYPGGVLTTGLSFSSLESTINVYIDESEYNSVYFSLTR